MEIGIVGQLKLYSCDSCGTVRVEGFRFCPCGSKAKDEIVIGQLPDGKLVFVKVDSQE